MIALDKKKYFEFIIFLLTLIFLSYVTITTFYPKGFIFEGHDTSFHLERFKAIHEAIKVNTYPYFIDYFILDGYGYATNLFYPDLTLMPFTFFIDYFGLINSYKILLFIYSILTGLLSFFCIKRISKNRYAGYFFAIVYTFALYRLTNMVIRGALGEMLAFTFIPCAFMSLYEIIWGNYKKYWYILSISLTLLLLTHLISFLLVSIFCIVFILYSFIIKKNINMNSRLLYLILSGLLTILLCSIFIFPLLEQMFNDVFYYKAHPAYPIIGESAIHPVWAFEGLFAGLTIGSYRIPDIGIILSLPLLTRIFILKRSHIIKIADISCILGIILLLACTQLFPWNIFPFKNLNIIQFPWRLSIFVTFFFAFSGSIYLSFLIPNKIRYYIVYLVIVFSIFYQIKLSNVNFINSQNLIIHKLHEYKISTFDRTIGLGEYIPASVPSVDYLRERGSSTITAEQPADISEFTRHKNRPITFKYNHTNNTKTTNSLVLPLIYYKGYKATLNNHNIELKQSKDGLVEIKVPKDGEVKVWYNGTTIQRISFLVSVISLIGLIIYVVFRNKMNRFKK